MRERHGSSAQVIARLPPSVRALVETKSLRIGIREAYCGDPTCARVDAAPRDRHVACVCDIEALFGGERRARARSRVEPCKGPLTKKGLSLSLFERL